MPQDLFNDPRMYNCDPEQQEKGVTRDDRNFNEAEKDNGNIESEYMNHFPRASSYCNKEITSRAVLAKEKDESTGKHHNSKTRTPPSRNQALETHSEERYTVIILVDLLFILTAVYSVKPTFATHLSITIIRKHQKKDKRLMANLYNICFQILNFDDILI